MQIGSIITPPPMQPAFRISRTPSATYRSSPLNSLRETLSSTQTLKKPANFTRLGLDEKSTQTHLLHLERLLQKESLAQPPPPQKESSPENRWRGALEGLNFAQIWRGWKKVAQMSPRHLHRLQRLLSKLPEYSPRNNLGDRWREYHGCNDWAGLLDPLDENLRREVVRYGEFVQAAYHAFHSNPATVDGETPRQVALPDRSYKVTKSLYATSSVGLPSWVDDVAPALGWMTQRSSWVGYVAVCDNEREIARMGRRDIVIALRGTATCLEWAEDFRAGLLPVPDNDGEGEEESKALQQRKVECGFWNLYKTAGGGGSQPHLPSLSEAIVEEIRRLMEQYKGEQLSITVTGHSLGAALALLAADELSTCASDVPPIAVFSFGGPRVGNRGFADGVEENGVKVLRVVNSQDLITKVPGLCGDDGDKGHLPWAYSHVGSELRVDSRSSPYLRPNADVACCHDLEAYLHLVDGYLASNCDFRADAKRSLVRLLHEQGSNMKRLYTGVDLTLDIERGVNVTPNCLASPS